MTNFVDLMRPDDVSGHDFSKALERDAKIREVLIYTDANAMPQETLYGGEALRSMALTDSPGIQPLSEDEEQWLNALTIEQNQVTTGENND